MSVTKRSPLFAWLAAASVSLAACSGHSTGALIPGGSFAAIRPAAGGPANCPHQTTSSKFAKVTQHLTTGPGSLCIPAFDGFGGSIEYPGVHTAQTMTLISSTTNYANLQLLGGGTPVFFEQLAISGAIQFGSSVPPGGGLTSSKIVAGKPYTLYAAGAIAGNVVVLPACYTIASKGPLGGVLGGIGTRLKNVSVPTKATAFIEVYFGKQVQQKC